MWCTDDVGRDSWDWVGPPAWGRACINSPEWGGGSSPVKTEPLQIVLLLLLCVVALLRCCVVALLRVDWLYYSKRIIIVRWADLSDFFRWFSSVKCVFLFHVQWKLSLFFGKTITPQNGLLIFLWKDTHSETKSSKSSRILTKKLQQQR